MHSVTLQKIPTTERSLLFASRSQCLSDVGSSLPVAIAKLLVLYFVEGLFQHTYTRTHRHTQIFPCQNLGSHSGYAEDSDVLEWRGGSTGNLMTF